MVVSMVHFSLNCSSCDHELLLASITVDGDTKLKDLLVAAADIACPKCNKHLVNAEDDIAREWKDINDARLHY